jgi:hypothetical protein
VIFPLIHSRASAIFLFNRPHQVLYISISAPSSTGRRTVDSESPTITPRIGKGKPSAMTRTGRPLGLPKTQTGFACYAPSGPPSTRAIGLPRLCCNEAIQGLGRLLSELVKPCAQRIGIHSSRLTNQSKIRIVVEKILLGLALTPQRSRNPFLDGVREYGLPNSFLWLRHLSRCEHSRFRFHFVHPLP